MAMSLTTAGILAMMLSFAACIAAAAWHVAPWLSRRRRAEALIPLLWVHAFRHVALQILSAQKFGFQVSDALRDDILYGDLVGMILALLAIFAVRNRMSSAVPLVWVFVAVTAVDLVNGSIGGTREGALRSASGVTWLILTFYVPILYTSLGLIVWQLVGRSRESLA
jgi:hypothetical protein